MPRPTGWLLAPGHGRRLPRAGSVGRLGPPGERASRLVSHCHSPEWSREYGDEVGPHLLPASMRDGQGSSDAGRPETWANGHPIIAGRWAIRLAHMPRRVGSRAWHLSLLRNKLSAERRAPGHDFTADLDLVGTWRRPEAALARAGSQELGIEAEGSWCQESAMSSSPQGRPCRRG